MANIIKTQFNDFIKLKKHKGNPISEQSIKIYNSQFNSLLDSFNKATTPKFLLNSDSEDLKISEFLERTITQINTSRKLEDIQDFIRYKFMARESKLFRTYIIKHTPSVLMDYEFEGEDGSTFNSGFPFGADFFWF